jgi:hypothetical protein
MNIPDVIVVVILAIVTVLIYLYLFIDIDNDFLKTLYYRIAMSISDETETPTCPWCRREFANWSLAKSHVKFCSKAPKPRKLWR